MKFSEYITKLETIKYLAKNKRTGTPRSLSKRLNISERTVYRLVQQLRETGYAIDYNRHRRSYEINDKK